MSVRLNLVQLNIEWDRHLDVVTQFLATEKPDVACLEEVLESDIPLLEKTLDATCLFAPASRRFLKGSGQIEGVGIFSRLPIKHSGREYYAGPGSFDAVLDMKDPRTIHQTRSCPLVWCEVKKGNTRFKIAATHFTWTPDGQADEFQREDMQALLRVLGELGELVLCGDFNAPRGGEIFDLLATRLTDNIPAEYTSSLDPELHRKKPLELMVDGIFSTAAHAVRDVERVNGLSDHCAFTASVERS